MSNFQIQSILSDLPEVISSGVTLPIGICPNDTLFYRTTDDSLWICVDGIFERAASSGGTGPTGPTGAGIFSGSVSLPAGTGIVATIPIDSSFSYKQTDGTTIWKISPTGGGPTGAQPKIDFSGLIDPIGLTLVPQNVNPNTVDPSDTLWINSNNNLTIGDRVLEYTNPISIGTNSGSVNQMTGSIALGTNSGYINQGTGSIAIGSLSGRTNQGKYSLAIGLEAGANNQGDFSIAFGGEAGADNQGNYSVAIGLISGLLTQGNNCVAIGSNAGFRYQNSGAIAIGDNSGCRSQGTGSIAIGSISGRTNQGEHSIAIGSGSGTNTQGNNSIAIGYNAGAGTQGNNSVAIGPNAGSTYQGSGSVAIGSSAGAGTQGNNSVAIGPNAGSTYQGSGSISLGSSAGRINQGVNCTAIGSLAGETGQGNTSISIGASAGQINQGANAIAIGASAGQINQGANAIAIGSLAITTNQSEGSIVINSSGTSLSSAATGGLYINPIRNNSAVIGIGGATGATGALMYNNTTKEFTWETGKSFVIEHPLDNTRNLVHICLEGPEAGVYYRGESDIIAGNCVEIQLPSYVDSLAKEFTIQLTPIWNGKMKREIYAGRVEDNKFSVYGSPGPFNWLVHGKRFDIDVEPKKSSIEVFGQGPYKWFRSRTP